MNTILIRLCLYAATGAYISSVMLDAPLAAVLLFYGCMAILAHALCETCYVTVMDSQDMRDLEKHLLADNIRIISVRVVPNLFSQGTRVFVEASRRVAA